MALEELGVRLLASRVESLELAAVPGKPARRVEVQGSRRLACDVSEEVDDARRREHERPRTPLDDRIADVELDLALEDEERVAVPLVEVGLNAASRLDLELDERELRPVGLDQARSDELAFAGGRAIGASIQPLPAPAPAKPAPPLLGGSVDALRR